MSVPTAEDIREVLHRHEVWKRAKDVNHTAWEAWRATSDNLLVAAREYWLVRDGIWEWWEEEA